MSAKSLVHGAAFHALSSSDPSIFNGAAARRQTYVSGVIGCIFSRHSVWSAAEILVKDARLAKTIAARSAELRFGAQESDFFKTRRFGDRRSGVVTIDSFVFITASQFPISYQAPGPFPVRAFRPRRLPCAQSTDGSAIVRSTSRIARRH